VTNNNNQALSPLLRLLLNLSQSLNLSHHQSNLTKRNNHLLSQPLKPTPATAMVVSNKPKPQLGRLGPKPRPLTKLTLNQNLITSPLQLRHIKPLLNLITLLKLTKRNGESSLL